MCTTFGATMTNAPVIIAQLRWIALIAGLFAFYLCTTLSSTSSPSSTPIVQTTGPSEARTEVMHEVQRQHTLTLLDEVPNSTEFASLDMMLAGRSNAAMKPSPVIEPTAGTPPVFKSPRAEKLPIALRY